MKTIFLAAGKSSRIQPISNKNLLKFMGKPLIIHLLENAQKGGLKNFIIVCNKDNKEVFEKILQQGNITAEFVLQPNLEDGVAGGVLAGLTRVKNNEPVFILGGNDYIDPKIYQQIITESKGIQGGILAKTVKTYFPGGYLKVDENNIIKEIQEKPGEGNEPSNLVNIMAHYFVSSDDLKTALSKAQSSKDDVYETALQNLFKTQTFKAVSYQNYWQAVKYPWHVLDMKDQIMKQNIQNISIHPTAEVSEKATLIGENIFIEAGVKIMNNATICGPCYIGKNTIIGQNTLIRQSNIGDNCVIGFNSEICRSFLADKVSTHAAYIGDSVVDSEVNFGAYSVTTNLRLDTKNVKVKIKDQLIDSKKEKLGSIVGKGAQIGSGAKIMPGRKINPNQLIAPNTVLIK
ncbi:hypothetical protein CSB37_01455 [bacterium DOLZORAL124_38_8]|nr:MAG: hypothetical protein CSB37_01455 [bacterium DOLZORAL124_38_8]